jgi:hypothetical protein
VTWALSAQPNSHIVYEIEAAGNAEITPLSTSLPNVSIEAQNNTSGNRWLSFSNDLLIRGNLTIDKGATLALHDGSNGNITVLGETNIGGEHSGHLLFRADGISRTMSCNNVTLKGSGMGADNQLSIETGGTAGLLHQLVVNGSLTQDNGTIDLFTNTANGSNVALTFTGSANAHFNLTAGTVPDLFRLILDKGTTQASFLTVNAPLSLGAASDAVVKPLELKNGTLVLDNASTDHILSSGGALFTIPASTGLVVSKGRVSINTHANGIQLAGRLRVDGDGIVSLGNGTNNIRIFIQYQGLTPFAGDSRQWIA